MDLNKVILIGRLACDPEFKEEIPMVRFRLAVKADSRANHTDFIPIVAFRKSAEFVNKYLTKGRLISLEGSLQVREYTTSEGEKRKEYGVIVKNITPLDKPKVRVEEINEISDTDPD